MSDSCPSALKLALSLVEGELGAGEREEIEKHLAGCERCRRRLEELRSEREALFEKRPSLNLTHEPVRKSWLPALAGACAVLLVVIGVWLFAGLGDEPGGIVFKGAAPALRVRVERRGHVFEGNSPLRLRPGDRIRFAYSVPEDAYLFIVNVDNEGRITPYYPARGKHSIGISRGTQVFLPGSIRLDDYLGKERIFAVFTRDPIAFEKLAAAIRTAFERHEDVERIEALQLPSAQETVLIIKEGEDD